VLRKIANLLKFPNKSNINVRVRKGVVKSKSKCLFNTEHRTPEGISVEIKKTLNFRLILTRWQITRIETAIRKSSCTNKKFYKQHTNGKRKILTVPSWHYYFICAVPLPFLSWHQEVYEMLPAIPHVNRLCI